MAKAKAKAAKLARSIEAAGEKVKCALEDGQPSSRAAGTPGSFLMAIFKSMILPALPAILSELLKSASASVKKYLRIARDVLVAADLDADLD